METMLKNPKHEHFAQLLSNGESAPRAYVLAGYSENGAEQGSSRLLKNVDVSSRVAHLRKFKEQVHFEAVQEAVHKSGVGKAWILERLKKVVEIGMKDEPIYDKEGAFTGEYKSVNLPAANKALELLGIEEGLFIKRVETGDPGDFERLNDDELDRRYAENQAAIRAAEAAIGNAQATARKATKAE
jgi:phage terminase small subunit